MEDGEITKEPVTTLPERPKAKPLPYNQILEMMIIETENEITKTSITERLTQRMSLRGVKQMNVPGGKVPIEAVLASTQSKIADLKKTLADLKDILQCELDEEKRKSKIKT